MDVTFFKHQSYYPKSEIQGEIMREYRLWDIPGIESEHSIQPGNTSQSLQTTPTNNHNTQNSILEQTQQTESHPPTTPV